MTQLKATIFIGYKIILLYFILLSSAQRKIKNAMVIHSDCDGRFTTDMLHEELERSVAVECQSPGKDARSVTFSFAGISR
jgi:hypothetical protein